MVAASTCQAAFPLSRSHRVESNAPNPESAPRKSSSIIKTTMFDRRRTGPACTASFEIALCFNECRPFAGTDRDRDNNERLIRRWKSPYSGRRSAFDDRAGSSTLLSGPGMTPCLNQMPSPAISNRKRQPAGRTNRGRARIAESAIKTGCAMHMPCEGSLRGQRGITVASCALRIGTGTEFFSERDPRHRTMWLLAREWRAANDDDERDAYAIALRQRDNTDNSCCSLYARGV